MGTKRNLKWGITLLLVSSLVILYITYNPNVNIYFPKCPFLLLTGFKCAGCGSQRAIHFLLNFDIYHAIKENVILVLSIPYIMTGLVLDTLHISSDNILKWRKTLFGQKAIYIVLSVIIAFWIIRNIT